MIIVGRSRYPYKCAACGKKPGDIAYHRILGFERDVGKATYVPVCDACLDELRRKVGDGQ